MIRELSYVQGALLSYEGTPASVALYCDGVLKETVTNLPTHDYHTTRRMTFGAGFAGFVNQLYVDHDGVLDSQILQTSALHFQRQQLWHYYEVTYTGTVKINVFLDERQIDEGGYIMKLPNIFGRGSDLTKRQTYTIKMFMPPLAYGRVPHLVTDDSYVGQVLDSVPIALPTRFYNKLQSVDEVQVTYAGMVTLIFYMDGIQIGGEYQLDSDVDKHGVGLYKNEKLHVAEGGTGTVFQWEQIAGDGDVVLVETNASLADMEATTKPEPG